MLDEPTTEQSSLVSSSHARELANSIDAIFVDTSARNDENVNLLFQKVAERVLLVREQAKNRGGLDGGGIDSIPVTTGASINEHGNVVKGNATSQEARRNSMNHSNNHHQNTMSAMNSSGGGGGAATSAPMGGLTTANHHHRPPIHNLERDSPERTLEKGGNGQIKAAARVDVPSDEEQVGGTSTSRSSSVGLCMGPLMECSSSKDDGSCTIC